MPGYTQSKDELQGRLRRVEGQVRGLQRLVDDDGYCIDVLTQISAVNAALRKVAVALLDDHPRHCVRDAASDDVPLQAVDRGAGLRRPVSQRSRSHHAQVNLATSRARVRLARPVEIAGLRARVARIGYTLGAIARPAPGRGRRWRGGGAAGLGDAGWSLWLLPRCSRW